MSGQDHDKSLFWNPWVQLFVGVVCMASVANLQYGWTFFVDPIDQKFGWGRADVAFAFSVFVFIETWLVPFEGYLVDRYGPRAVVVGGAVLVAFAWCLNSVADTRFLLYLGAALGGTGTGAVYGTCVGNALKWFPRRRGLAAGITAAGFGAGAYFTTGPIATMIESAGYQHAFLVFGLAQGAIVLVMSTALRRAPVVAVNLHARSSQSSIDYHPREVLRAPVFWLLYLIFVLVAIGGLTLTQFVVPLARDMGIDHAPVKILWFAGPAAVLAVQMDRVFDGIGRPLFGWISDRIGRENTMFIAFVLGALFLYALAHSGSDPLAFVLASALYFMVFGEIYSLFPATQGDTFGAKFAAANSGMLYTAKGSAALLSLFAPLLAARAGWESVFALTMGLNLTAAFLALLVLKPLRRRHLARGRAAIDARAAAATGAAWHEQVVESK